MKVRSEYICQQCGYRSSAFMGKCPNCGEWNTLVETSVSTENSKFKIQNSKFSEENLLRLKDVKGQQVARFSTGFGEFDRVLGGGIVPGSIILISGDPGIGKSTLLLQTAMQVADSGKLRKLGKSDGQKVRKSDEQILRSSSTQESTVGLKSESLKNRQPESSEYSVWYVTGEESSQQVKLRADRLGKTPEGLYILPETD